MVYKTTTLVDEKIFPNPDHPTIRQTIRILEAAGCLKSPFIVLLASENKQSIAINFISPNAKETE